MAKPSVREWLEEHLSKEHSSECVEWPFYKTPKGYGTFSVSENNKSRAIRANRYVCEAVHGPPPTLEHQAAHSCGNAWCVNPRHLRWATQLENEADKVEHGTADLSTGQMFLKGEKHWSAKLTENDVHEIRHLIKGGISRTAIASKFHATYDAIRDIDTGRTWAWLETPGIKKPHAA